MATELYTLRAHVISQNQHSVHGFHFQGVGLTANDTLVNSQDLLDSFITTLEGPFLNCFGDNQYLDGYVVSRTHPTGSAEARVRYDPGSAPGNIPGDFQANALCPAVRIIPGMGGTVVNRVFMPPAPDSAIDNNAYAAGYLSAVSTLFTTAIASFGSGSITWTLACWSPKLSTYTEAATFNLSPRFGFQRRRALPM